MLESVNIKGSPDVVLPGGSADFDLDDLDEPYTLLAVWGCEGRSG